MNKAGRIRTPIIDYMVAIKNFLPRKEYLADPLYELAICANSTHLGGQYCSTLLGTFGVVRTLLQDVSMPWKE
jgi:hypothetical protein